MAGDGFAPSALLLPLLTLTCANTSVGRSFPWCMQFVWSATFLLVCPLSIPDYVRSKHSLTAPRAHCRAGPACEVAARTINDEKNWKPLSAGEYHPQRILLTRSVNIQLTE